MNIFVLKWSKIAAQKKVFFLLILPWSTLLWHRCYNPHRSRDALSPVCGIFSFNLYLSSKWICYELKPLKQCYLFVQLCVCSSEWVSDPKIPAQLNRNLVSWNWIYITDLSLPELTLLSAAYYWFLFRLFVCWHKFQDSLFHDSDFRNRAVKQSLNTRRLIRAYSGFYILL